MLFNFVFKAHPFCVFFSSLFNVFGKNTVKGKQNKQKPCKRYYGVKPAVHGSAYDKGCNKYNQVCE